MPRQRLFAPVYSTRVWGDCTVATSPLSSGKVALVHFDLVILSDHKRGFDTHHFKQLQSIADLIPAIWAIPIADLIHAFWAFSRVEGIFLFLNECLYFSPNYLLFFREIPFSLIQFPLWEFLKKQVASVQGILIAQTNIL